MNNTETTKVALVNGQRFEIIEENENGIVTVRRPNGSKTYRAKAIRDGRDQIYGANRYQIQEAR